MLPISPPIMKIDLIFVHLLIHIIFFAILN